MSKTLIILNPHAAGGRAGQLWTRIEPLLWERLGELVVAVTERPEDVAPHLDKAYAAGLNRVISVGGDGTNHALVNALVQLNEQHPGGPQMVYGNLPVGTGRDWARSHGIPLNLEAAADWIAGAVPGPVDLGLLHYHASDQPAATRVLHFLNIASVGLGGEVDARVNRKQVRRPWTFLKATVETLLTYKPGKLRIILDGEVWYEDRALTVVIANGTTFGHGMKIAPDARTDDGLFDVVVVDALSKIEVLAALRKVYDGSHIEHPGVHFNRAKHVQVDAGGPLAVDVDGEYTHGSQLNFSVRPGLLQMLG